MFSVLLHTCNCVPKWICLLEALANRPVNILRQMHHFLQDIGAGKGKYYAVNYPLRDGIDDESYEAIFKPVSSFL